MSTFLKLIAASYISRRKVVSISRQLVCEVLGEKFVTQTSVDLNEPFAETSNDTPLLFILSQGADPRESLEKLAEEHGYSKKLHILSLGQGRGPTANALIKESKRNGDWVFLQNYHLYPSFLPKLENISSVFPSFPFVDANRRLPDLHSQKQRQGYIRATFWNAAKHQPPHSYAFA